MESMDHIDIVWIGSSENGFLILRDVFLLKSYLDGDIDLIHNIALLRRIFFWLPNQYFRAAPDGLIF